MLSYSTIAWGDKGVQPNVDYGYKARTTAGTVGALDLFVCRSQCCVRDSINYAFNTG